MPSRARRLTGRIGPALLVVSLLLASWARADAATEVIEFRSGSVFEGEVTSLAADSLTLALADGATMTVSLKDLTPYSVYRVRARRVLKKDAQGHWDLGIYCLENHLFNAARTEFTASAEADPECKAMVEAKLAETTAAEAQSMFDDAKELLDSGDIENALKAFQLLVTKHPKSPLVDAAQQAIADATAALKAESDKKQQAIDLAQQKAAAAQQAQGEAGLKQRFDAALKSIADGKKLNVDGLDYEGETKVSRADRAYQAALTKFEEAGDALDGVLAVTKDADLITVAKDQRVATERWRVICCDNLANLWAIELNFREALRWCNRSLAIDPADHVATELKLEIARQMLRRSSLRSSQSPAPTGQK